MWNWKSFSLRVHKSIGNQGLERDLCRSKGWKQANESGGLMIEFSQSQCIVSAEKEKGDNFKELFSFLFVAQPDDLCSCHFDIYRY